MKSIKHRNLEKRAKRLAISSVYRVDSLASGMYRSLFKGQGIEFNEVRSYAEGDDARSIDWNVSSRLGDIYCKTFREERELEVMVIADASASMLLGAGRENKIETAANIFALFGLIASNNSDRMGSVIFGNEIDSYFTPHKGRHYTMSQVERYLKANEKKDVVEGSNLSLALKTVIRRQKRRGLTIIISDFKVSQYEDELALLSRRSDVIAIRITDPLDARLPRFGLLKVKDPESKKTALLYGYSQRLHRHYSSNNKKEEEEWLTLCTSNGVDALTVSTKDKPEIRLKEFFLRRRGKHHC